MPPSCTCKKVEKRKIQSTYLSVFGAFFIAILPKCPLCIMAYSSAITMCSGKKIYHADPTWATYISISLAIFTLFIVLYNYKGIKTIIAAILVIIGSFFIFNSEFYSGEIFHYNLGAMMLLLGVWLNANLMYFVKKFHGRKFRSQAKRDLVSHQTSDL